MTRFLSILTLLIFACTSFVQTLPYPNNTELHKPPLITHDLVHGINGAIGGAIINGKDGAVAGAFGAMLGGRLAKTLMPTKVEVTETITNAAGEKVQVTKTIRPEYAPERVGQVHALIHFAIGTSAFLTGMDVTQMATAVNASVIAVEHNHGDTLRRRDGGLDTVIEEEADEADEDDVDDIPLYDTDDDVDDIGFVNKKGQFIPKDDKQNHVPTPKQSTQVDDLELSFLSHLQAETGDFTVTCDHEGRPLTPRSLAALKATQQFEIDLAKADERQLLAYKLSGITGVLNAKRRSFWCKYKHIHSVYIVVLIV